MPRMIALDWDRLEARMVVGQTKGDGQISVEKVASVPIDLDSQDTNFEGLEEQLAKALGSIGASRSQALTAIGRSMVELRTMNLPPAPDEELPDMVRFQAMREFSNLKEESRLDFVPLGTAGTEPGQVMAAAIPVDLSRQIDAALATHGHEPTRSVVRPCSAASLAMRHQPAAATGVTMIVSQQSDSAELSVAKDGKVVFTRSFRLPPNWHPGETGQPLLGEVRRTIVAAANQLGGAKIERVVMFGTESEHGSVRDHVKEQTDLPVTLLDPFDGVQMRGTKPDQPERYAALVGMLRDESSEDRPVIDFQNPRKRPEPESNRRQHVLYGATAAAVLLGLLFLVWWQHKGLDDRRRSVQAELRKVSRENKSLGNTVALAKKLNEWKMADKNWLDEFAHLSTSDELDAEDFRLVSISARTARDGGGAITIRGRAKDPEARRKFQRGLVDENHKVVPGQVLDDTRQDERYPILFTTTVHTNSHMPIIRMPTAPPAASANETTDDVIAEGNPTSEGASPTEESSTSEENSEPQDAPEENTEPANNEENQ